ncbi:hypothetical protein ASG19_00300 [Rhizobium sp. Leaf306]|jgi:uncharacterized protein (DUF983 family)|uniref:DUF983 domain-containing protein n=1 Tax=Rhizobium/Agrobacterium group TaxID=227290 RepID=UPI000713BF6E|nr:MULTISPECIES: DUF983 domain-containing protein [unclassified Rhizobium]KQQ37596.1 hypothetical protein ASG19_00300 [Rhizobium sp. Leaf306]KQQ74322.1 hypothetical protein ASF70_11435 [Rhizobium sp. Leaf321]RYE67911.1 MAG: DUF983 domain-containing protein [Rhizobiaceae bacterium]SEH24570.1 Uncharacterized conserved protein, DUF983 family [Rhizobium sp. NFR12]
MQSDGEQTVRFGGSDPVDRPLGRSIKRGLACRCPACGEGRLFRAFLKPVDHCSVCGEDISHHRADDLPAYLVIVVVGHVLMTGYMLTDMILRVSPWVHLAIWAPLAVLAAIATIQPIKGGVIGLQWANRMHGFGGGEDGTDSTSGPSNRPN